ncbi:MAG: SLBB domain-containing protein [Elusimicrobia bacterium]|nr:SLBB domain-containing protein [Elusimicrobiota bacterium]
MQKDPYSSSSKKQLLRLALLLVFFGGLGLAGWLYRNGYVKFTSGKDRDRKVKVLEMVYVHVDGAVKKPGLYRVKKGSRIGQAVETAGGLTQDADLAGINLADRVRDGQKITVPLKGGFLKKYGIGRGPEHTYINPPLEVKKEE